MDKPIYCFTFDLDWAAETVIKHILNIFREADIPLTPFITHKSKVIEKEYEGKMFKVGLHPNFNPKSSHGSTYDEVINHVISLNPESKFFRSHGFYENTNILYKFAEKGFLFDSNLPLKQQENIVPLKHSSGIIRFPVFLEDDYYLYTEPDFKPKTMKKELLSPGLKIFNIHPVHIWINTPYIEYYRNVKLRASYGTDRNKDSPYILRWYNKGIETFTLDLIKFLKRHSNQEFYYLYDLYELLKNGKTPKI